MSSGWAAIPGVLIIGFALREIFKDLFQPTATGDLSSFIGRGLFRTAKRVPSTLPTVGPLSVLVVILCWVLLLACGFGLVYWAGYPDNFRFSVAPEKADRGFSTVFYFSLETLTTLGLGEISPRPGWTEWAVAAEALLGLSLFTASISWFVLLYPALGRLRTLARRASILARASETTGIDVVRGDVKTMLADLTLDVIRMRVDFVHFPIIYYFHAGSEHASLPRALKQLVEYSEIGTKEECTDQVRFAAAALNAALADLAKLLANRFLHINPADTKAVFHAYAADHLQKVD